MIDRHDRHHSRDNLSANQINQTHSLSRYTLLLTLTNMQSFLESDEYKHLYELVLNATEDAQGCVPESEQEEIEDALVS
jgi:hypothetical protein